MRDIRKLNRSEAQKVRAMVARILRTWESCTADELSAGLAWYSRANNGATALAELSGLSFYQCAGIIAALSPREKWATNIANAYAIVEAACTGQECPSVGLSANVAKAWRIAKLSRELSAAEELLTIESILYGKEAPKVLRFFRNITGDVRCVTVDTWAFRIAGDYWKPHPRKPGEWAETPSLTLRQYELCEVAYQRAADALGVFPRDVQAATWVHVRGAAD